MPDLESGQQLILNQLENLQQKTDRLSDKMIVIIAQQAVHTEQLAEHMRRTAQMEDAFAPIKKHVNQIDGGLKLIGGIGAALGMILAAIKIFAYL